MGSSSRQSEGRALLAALALSAVNSVAGCGRGGPALGLVAHDKFFVVTGSHRSFSCDQCHSASAPSFALAEGGVDCIACHTVGATSPLHSAVPLYSWATGSCISCHKDPSGGLPAKHNVDFFPVTGTKHASLGCPDCHGATKAVAEVTCVPCHAQSDTNTKHAAIPSLTTGRRDGVQYTNYQWTSAFCLKCHADGQVNFIASHPSAPIGINGGSHQPFCLTCHATSGPTGGKAWATNFADSSCLPCHLTKGGL